MSEYPNYRSEHEQPMTAPEPLQRRFDERGCPKCGGLFAHYPNCPILKPQYGAAITEARTPSPLPEEPPAKFYGNHLPPNAPKALQRRPDEIAEEPPELKEALGHLIAATRNYENLESDSVEECDRYWNQVEDDRARILALFCRQREEIAKWKDIALRWDASAEQVASLSSRKCLRNPPDRHLTQPTSNSCSSCALSRFIQLHLKCAVCTLA